eukprot:5755104-Amphidinium_carterae.1
MPHDFPTTAREFTHQDFYFVVIHTTERLLENSVKTSRTKYRGRTIQDGIHGRTKITSSRSKQEKR